MKNVLPNHLGAVFLVFVLLTACKKKDPDLPVDPNELHTLTLKLKGFTAQINPLTFRSGSSVTSERYLYFWSFNQENTVPDEAIHALGPEINSNGGNVSYTIGWGLSPYDAGKGYNAKGAESIVVKMPLRGTTQLNTLAFDAGSSGTGPKNFKLYYSVDGGAAYSILSDNNQFTNFSINGRNGFEFDLSVLLDIDYEGSLTIKIEPFEGDRGEGGSAYNPSTGTFKIDNFRLSGMHPVGGGPDPNTEISKIYYHIFNAQDHALVVQGEMPFNAAQLNPELSVRLPKGQFYASIISNASAAELLFPETLTQASQFYIGNPFANKSALIFGAAISDLVVDESAQLDVTLKRYFSEVGFEFTDQEDLTGIGRISIAQEHADFFYNPFGILPGVPAPVSLPIDIIPAFTSGDNRISFHQFMGDVVGPVGIAYSVSVYDKDDTLLRVFSVNSNLTNNVQLLFRGLLLDGVEQSSGFQIQWNEQWGEPQTETF